jgi:hypothetical protein
MSELRSFAVLLVSQSEYRIDGDFRYAGATLPKIGDRITVEEVNESVERHARVRRVNAEEAFPIHATDETSVSPEWTVGPRERSRRRSEEVTARALNGRRGWLRRQRRRLGA